MSSTHGIHPPIVSIHPWYCNWHLSMIFIHPWYVSTHVIHPHMEFTHGIVSGIYPWYWPMVSTYGIYTCYCNSKKAINNKPQFVKGQIFHHNVASTVILCFNKTSFFVVLFAMCSLFFSCILILQILSDPFQFFIPCRPPSKIQITNPQA